MKFLLVGLMISGLLAASGCGGSSSGGTTTVTTTAQPANAVSRDTQFAQCVKKIGSGVKFMKNPPATSGRIPRVKVPGTYIGAVVQKDGSQFDIWIAPSPADADRAAKLLNEALSKKIGSEAVGAFARGLFVSALANNGKNGDLDVASASDRCTDGASQ